ncbi:hypothetical protein ACTWLT_31195 [Micromonospora sp. ZYX-F-536]|uniref:hypothetical protein n=1 Tax=Micromonospora sp. ZYX-F-536 TaxID=3457629 RepID=UPI00404079D5
MTDTSDETPPAHSAGKVLAALADLGEATASAVAEHAGLGYSTTTPSCGPGKDPGRPSGFAPVTAARCGGSPTPAEPPPR